MTVSLCTAVCSRGSGFLSPGPRRVSRAVVITRARWAVWEADGAMLGSWRLRRLRDVLF